MKNELSSNYLPHLNCSYSAYIALFKPVTTISSFFVLTAHPDLWFSVHFYNWTPEMSNSNFNMPMLQARTPMVFYRESFKFSWMFIKIFRRTVKYESQIYLVNWKLINILDLNTDSVYQKLDLRLWNVSWYLLRAFFLNCPIFPSW